jgi:hypothetical protein
VVLWLLLSIFSRSAHRPLSTTKNMLEKTLLLYRFLDKPFRFFKFRTGFDLIFTSPLLFYRLPRPWPQ